jgi:deazaflavin-dependent oxidoreductase (nitroreductase family)
MPMPKWWGHINKRVFNPGQIKKGVSPVLTHVGRASGRTFQTPLDAHPVDDGYIFILVYGSGSDWVKNIMAAGNASLRVKGEEIPLTSPRVITEEAAWELLPPTTKRPPKFLRISEYLQMDTSR